MESGSPMAPASSSSLARTRGGVVAEVLKDAEALPGAVCRGDQRVAFRHADGHGLLQGEVLARLQGGDAHRGMQVVGRDHLHRVHVGVGQERAVIGVRLRDAPLPGPPLEQPFVDIAEGVQLGLGVVVVAQGVQAGNAPDADHPNA